MLVEGNVGNPHDISCHSGLRMDSLAKRNKNVRPLSLGTLHNAWAGAGLHRETLWACKNQARERKCTDIIHHPSICFSYMICCLIVLSFMCLFRHATEVIPTVTQKYISILFYSYVLYQVCFRCKGRPKREVAWKYYLDFFFFSFWWN